MATITFTNSGTTDVYMPLMGQSGAVKVIPAQAGVEGSDVPAVTLAADDIVWYPASDFDSFYTEFLADYPQITMTSDKDDVLASVDITAKTAGASSQTVTITKVDFVKGEDTKSFTDAANIEIAPDSYDSITITLDGYEDIVLTAVTITEGSNTLLVYVPAGA